MVDYSNTLDLASMPSTKAGLTEAILLPYLELSDVCRLMCANRAWKNLLNPCSYKHINLPHILGSRIFFESDFDSPVYNEFAHEIDRCETWSEIRQIMAKYDSCLTKVTG